MKGSYDQNELYAYMKLSINNIKELLEVHSEISQNRMHIRKINDNYKQATI